MAVLRPGWRNRGMNTAPEAPPADRAAFEINRQHAIGTVSRSLHDDVILVIRIGGQFAA